MAESIHFIKLSSSKVFSSLMMRSTPTSTYRYNEYCCHMMRKPKQQQQQFQTYVSSRTKINSSPNVSGTRLQSKPTSSSYATSHRNYSQHTAINKKDDTISHNNHIDSISKPNNNLLLREFFLQHININTRTISSYLLNELQKLANNNNKTNHKNNKTNKHTTTDANPNTNSIFSIHRIGDHPYGSRQYHLHVTIGTTKTDNGSGSKKIASLSAHRNVIFGAKVYYQEDNIKHNNDAKKNEVAGENKVMNSDQDDDENDSTTVILQQLLIPIICRPLLYNAVIDASEQGEQPQALSTLYGLCNYVRTCLMVYEADNNSNVRSSSTSNSNHVINSGTSQVLHDLFVQMKSQQQKQQVEDEQTTNPQDSQTVPTTFSTSDAKIKIECIRAIATGIPRPGQSIVGIHTHNTVAKEWYNLAIEYANQSKYYMNPIPITTAIPNDINKNNWENNSVESFYSAECQLYWSYNNTNESLYYRCSNILDYKENNICQPQQELTNKSNSTELVDIELVADKREQYMKSAGGAMARFFFL